MPQLISPEYAALNRQLHEERDDYGAKAYKDATDVAKLATKNGLKVILDYGCGKGTLKPAIASIDPTLEVLEYDPAISGKDVLPTRQVDVIAALDVMEHIEPDYLEGVLQSMVSLSPRCVYLLIATRPALKTLADGRNAHLILESTEWWVNRLAPYFNKVFLQERPPGSFIYVGQTRSDAPQAQN